MREAYAVAARESGVLWRGRNYQRDQWDAADPVNRALSAANACLYGLCHAAILSGGYSPALGFIHTGKQLSFVYDVADLYKVRHILPIAFREAASGNTDLEPRVRRACRDLFRSQKMVERILPDIAAAMNVPFDSDSEGGSVEQQSDADEEAPTDWWQPDGLTADTPIGRILEQAVREPWKPHTGGL